MRLSKGSPPSGELEGADFHPDHLGSSSYITNLAGTVSQHIEYLPFGELLVDEHLNSHNSPFKFNAKELDPETGNYYYGARYYDSKWSMWLSVDPLAGYNPVIEVEHYIDGQHNGGVFNDKNLNSYSYTYQNPIIYVDPNGKQVYFQNFERSSYEGKGALGKTGVFIGNSVKSVANGLIDIWNYSSDLTNPDDYWDMKYGVDKMVMFTLSPANKKC